MMDKSEKNCYSNLIETKKSLKVITMIKNYSFENFQSYRDRCDVDFTVSRKTAHSYYDYELPDGSKVAKVMTVVGANGAGKSNLLKPLAFLSWFVVDSFGSIERGEDIPIYPYFLTHEKNTKIDLEFVVPKFNDDDATEFEYKYSLELNDHRVINESLKFKSSKLYSNIITREYNSSENKYNIKNSKKFGVELSDTILKKTPSNCSILSYVYNFISDEERNLKFKDDSSNSLLMLAVLYFDSFRTNISALGRRNLSETVDIANDFYLSNPDCFEKIKSLLKSYDLGVSDISLDKKLLTDSETGKEFEKIIPIFKHQAENGSFEIPIFLESSGTQSAFCILALVMQTIEVGGVAILDEFDNDLHPHLTIEIINLFRNREINKRNAQLLFNTHTVDVLKTLRMQHCYLVEKINSISNAYRADQVEGLLARDNLYAKYISGALGAVPDIQ